VILVVGANRPARWRDLQPAEQARRSVRALARKTSEPARVQRLKSSVWESSRAISRTERRSKRRVAAYPR